jgi:hypothetical protein
MVRVRARAWRLLARQRGGGRRWHGCGLGGRVHGGTGSCVVAYGGTCVGEGAAVYVGGGTDVCEATRARLQRV